MGPKKFPSSLFESQTGKKGGVFFWEVKSEKRNVRVGGR